MYIYLYISTRPHLLELFRLYNAYIYIYEYLCYVPFFVVIQMGCDITDGLYTGNHPQMALVWLFLG